MLGIRLPLIPSLILLEGLSELLLWCLLLLGILLIIGIPILILWLSLCLHQGHVRYLHRRWHCLLLWELLLAHHHELLLDELLLLLHLLHSAIERLKCCGHLHLLLGGYIGRF